MATPPEKLFIGVMKISAGLVALKDKGRRGPTQGNGEDTVDFASLGRLFLHPCTA
jgi:hypothetical protein